MPVEKITVPGAALSWNSKAELALFDSWYPCTRILFPLAGVQTVTGVPAVMATASMVL